MTLHNNKPEFTSEDQALLDSLGISESDCVPVNNTRPRREILAELGLLDSDGKLPDARPRRMRADSISRRVKCNDFARWKNNLDRIRNQLISKELTVIKYNMLSTIDKKISVGCYYVLQGQICMVIDIFDHERTRTDGNMERRARVIYDNGTESYTLVTSLAAALRRVNRFGKTSYRIIHNL